MTPDEGRERCEKRAERGIKRAAFKHSPEIRRDTLRMLDALLASPTGIATLDDATPDLKAKHADGGKWRGDIPKRLKAEKLIVAETVVKSSRLHRNAGYLTAWRLIDRNAAEARRAILAAELQRDAGESAATDSPAVDPNTNPTSNGVNDDGQVD